MTSEQRLDRLERIAKLFVAAGLRARRNMRDLDEKIGILVNMQIHNEEKFKDEDDKINILIDLQRHNGEKFKDQGEKISTLIDLQRHNEKRFGRLVEAQTNTNQRLDSLIEIIRNGQNGNSQERS